jgi:peptide/nickel transport system permease protein
VSWLIFFIMWIIPGDVAIAMLGDGANPDTVAALRQHMGLNDPWYVQYGRWIGNRVSGSIETDMCCSAYLFICAVQEYAECIYSEPKKAVPSAPNTPHI